jgi:pantoate ligase / CMP/dCMP kinase
LPRLHTVEQVRAWRSAAAGSVGFVPTMGALHRGHQSLIGRARQENVRVLVSIFVNPLQFGPSEDFSRYPRTLDADAALCAEAGVDAIFAPSATGLGLAPDATPTQVIPPKSLISGLCGLSRPGHFEGVATIVTKLLNIVQPTRAYFGEKDAQQLAVIRRLVQDLNLATAVVGCPIVREANGLALSSRNQYLSPQQRQQAGILYQALVQAAICWQAPRKSEEKGGNQGENLSGLASMDKVLKIEQVLQQVRATLANVPDLAPEYVELVNPDTMQPLDTVSMDTQTNLSTVHPSASEPALLAIAARLGTTRLIDNMRLDTPMAQDRSAVDLTDLAIPAQIGRAPIVAIDGPAGAGKSTVTRRVAEQLGLMYLDTGAMYRAITWLVLNAGVAVEDETAVAEIVNCCEIRFELPIEAEGQPQIWVNGVNVTREIRSLEVTAQVSAIAAQSAVRSALVRQQQSYGKTGGLVAEGRDIGTQVFPNAELKIFLTASAAERAKRRQLDLVQQGKPEVPLAELEQLIRDRDHKDSTRAISPLQRASDALEVNTDGLSAEDVIERIVQLYQERVKP